MTYAFKSVLDMCDEFSCNYTRHSIYYPTFIMISVRSGSKHHLRTSLSVSSSEAAKTGPVTPVVNTNGPSPPTRCVLTRFFFPPKSQGGKSKLLGIGKSLSEAFILASTNPQYDNRLFIELQVQHMKISSSDLGRT